MYCRGSQEIITEKLSMMMDRYNISDRDAVRIISPTIESLGIEKIALEKWCLQYHLRLNIF